MMNTGTWLELAGREVALAGNCSLGRSSSNSVVIADAKASRHHATIHLQDEGEFWLIDLGSINGTALNDRRVVRPVRLRDGDRVVIAETALIFRQGEADIEASLAGETMVTLAEVRNEARWLLVADIEDFTPMSQRLAPEELATLVGQWVRAGREIVERHGGMMNKYLGDGYLACWRGADTASIAGAVAAFRELRAAGKPKFRVVVHYGMVSIGGAASHGEECLMGPEVNFVFRVEKAAGDAGAAFCFTAAAREQLAPHLALVALAGGHAMKGFAGEHELFGL